MLVLHPSSTCDVCLEGYGGRSFPNVISCGHSFCLRCLQSLTRQCCPLCRKAFAVSDVRRLHVDRANSSSPLSPDSLDVTEESSQCRRFQDRITRIVFEGADNTDIDLFSKEADRWLRTQPSDEHAHLRAVIVLLRKHINVVPLYKAAQQDLAQLQKVCDDLKEKFQTEKEAGRARYEELEQSSALELENAKAVENSLREQLDFLQNDWTSKYEVCLEECRMLIEQVNELKRKRHNARALSRTVDARYLFEDRDHPNKEFMTIATDDVPDATSILKSHQVAGDDGFRLSPIPPDLPLPSLPSGIFPALTEESDDDDGASKALLQRSGNPHSRRSIPVIPIASNIHRMHSNSSLLSSHDMDPVSRSLPRALMDVHMVNFSSSPNVQGYPYTSRERFGDMISSSLGAHEGGLGLRIAGMGRPSDGPEPDDQDKQRERLRAELRRVLEDPPPTTIVRRNTVSEPEHVRRTSATASSVFTRNPSPDSTSPPSSCASAVAVPSSSGAPLPVSTAQHQPVSRASTAAMAAERARASAASSTSTSPTSAMASRERDVTQPQPQSYSQTRPSNPRRVSTDSTKAKTLTTTTATASNLTRTIWAMQEAQRITQQEVQRVS